MITLIICLCGDQTLIMNNIYRTKEYICLLQDKVAYPPRISDWEKTNPLFLHMNGLGPALFGIYAFGGYILIHALACGNNLIQRNRKNFLLVSAITIVFNIIAYTAGNLLWLLYFWPYVQKYNQSTCLEFPRELPWVNLSWLTWFPGMTFFLVAIMCLSLMCGVIIILGAISYFIFYDLPLLFYRRIRTYGCSLMLCCSCLFREEYDPINREENAV